MSDYQHMTIASCPHCGKQLRDTWELFSAMEETVETDCGSCEQAFSITRDVTFYYSASAINDEPKSITGEARSSAD